MCGWGVRWVGGGGVGRGCDSWVWGCDRWGVGGVIGGGVR